MLPVTAVSDGLRRGDDHRAAGVKASSSGDDQEDKEDERDDRGRSYEDDQHRAYSVVNQRASRRGR